MAEDYQGRRATDGALGHQGRGCAGPRGRGAPRKARALSACVTADTTVIVSALNYPGGNPARLLKMPGAIQIAISEAILAEVADVLERKFAWPAQDIASALFSTVFS